MGPRGIRVSVSKKLPNPNTGHVAPCPEGVEAFENCPIALCRTPMYCRRGTSFADPLPRSEKCTAPSQVPRWSRGIGRRGHLLWQPKIDWSDQLRFSYRFFPPEHSRVSARACNPIGVACYVTLEPIGKSSAKIVCCYKLLPSVAKRRQKIEHRGGEIACAR